MNHRISLIAALAVACTPSSSSSTSTPDSDPSPTVPLDQSCTDGVSQSLVNEQIAVMEETEASYHEMIACGGLAFQVSSSLYEILITSILNSNGVEVPSGFVYNGDGTYGTASDSSTMTVHYLYGDDLEVGAEDEPILYDLFDFDNYLRGVSAAIDYLAQEAEISYDSAGPLVELLGKGANPPNPMRLSLDEIEEPYRLGRVKMVTEVTTDDPREGATVSYTLTSAPRRINPMLKGDSALTFDLTSSTTIAANGATLTSTEVGIDYDDTPGNLTGDIPFELRGGGLDLDGVLSYQNSTYAEVSWWCPGDSLGSE
jgi:hypothetical protein